jgi:hypothetical protein
MAKLVAFTAPRKWRGGVPFADHFTVAFERGCVELSRQHRGSLGWQLVFWAMAELRSDRWVEVSQGERARDLGVSRPAVSKAMAELVESGVFERSEDNPREYRLNADLFWRGRSDGWHRHQRLRGREARKQRDYPKLEEVAAPGFAEEEADLFKGQEGRKDGPKKRGGPSARKPPDKD